jgi:parallel beta-helix repeat protein
VNNSVYADIICVDPLNPSCHKSIQEGIDAAVSGDTVEVASGTYVEQVTLKSGITVTGENRDTTSIWNNNDTVIGQQIQNTVIQGFTITSSAGNGIYLSADTSNVKIIYNIIIDCADNGIWVNQTPYWGGTFYIDIENNVVKNNRIGISYNSSSQYGETILHGFAWNNILLENIDGGIIIEGNRQNNVKVVNNVIYSNSADGIKITSAGNPYISNNIVMKNGNYGITQNTTAAPTVAFNDVYNNTAGDYNGVIVGPGSISVDPQFVDETNEDFHLLSNSPAIDAGNSVNTPPEDIDGDIRPYGGYDIGVDEYTGALPPGPCECDLNHDGSCNILDWPYFIEDWGRSDCPVP